MLSLLVSGFVEVPHDVIHICWDFWWLVVVGCWQELDHYGASSRMYDTRASHEW